MTTNELSGPTFTELDHSVIRYSKVWEDYAIARAALELSSDDDLLIVSSAGCNVLNLALSAPRSILCIDISVSQTALTELRVCAIPRLTRTNYLELLGYLPSDARDAYYEVVRSSLSETTRQFWDSRISLLKDGIQDCGRFDSYLLRFWQDAVADVITKNQLMAFCGTDELQRQAMFRQIFDTDAFRTLFVQYFSKENMAANGRHPTQFRYVDDGIHVGEVLWDRFKNAIIKFGISTNPYMQAFMFGNYLDNNAEVSYISEAGYNKLQLLVDRITVVRANLNDILSETDALKANKYYLSNMFEYMSADETDNLIGCIGAKSFNADVRACYWNFLVLRGEPGRKFCGDLALDIDLSQKLSAIDRSWIYKAFWALRRISK